MGIRKTIEEIEFINEIDLESYLMHLIKTNRKKSYFFVCSIKGDGSDWDQRSFHKSEVDKALSYIKKNKNKRIFVPTVLFNSRERIEEEINQIRKIIIDLDIYKIAKFKNMKPENVFEDLKNRLFDTGIIPMSNAVTFSGGGLYLEWEFKYTPGGNVLKKRRVIAKILFEMLKEYAPDAKSLDAVHVFGLTGTTNWKYGQEVTVRTFTNELPAYTLAELSRMLPSLWDVWKKEKKIEIEKEKKYESDRKDKSGARIVPIHKERTLAHDHIVSLKQLIVARDGDMEFFREKALFFARNAYHKMHIDRFNAADDDLFYESYQLACEINEMFAEPLTEKEIRKSTLNKKKLYKFKTETINEWFETSLDEQIKMKVKTPEAKKEKSKREMRKLNGISEKNTHDYKEKIIKEYFEKNPDATNVQAEKDLGISRPTIIKHRPKK